MKGKIILNLAMSIDGFIADEDGGYDWITHDGDTALNTKEHFNFDEFLNSIDVVLMGSKCYEQGMAEPYENKTVYVATTKKIDDKENIKFISGDIVSIVEKEKLAGKNVFLFGGGSAIDPFIKKDVIDEYYIGIIPVILGKGRRLFLENNPTIKLKLSSYVVDSGVVIMQYIKS